MHICLPYAKHFLAPEEKPAFKLLGSLTFHNMGWGYTCFVSAFAVFVSEKEIKMHKSEVIQKFSEIKSIDDFKALDLP